jgi:AcrR family transcriptional regulator
LYLYFKNKEELYASLSLRILQYLHIRVEHVNKDSGKGAVDKIKALTEAMFDVYEFDPLILINMFHLQSSETLKNLSPPLLKEIEELSRKSLGAIARILREGSEQDLFIARHPVAMADVFWALFSGIILWNTSKKIINEDKDYLQKTLELGFEIFRRGIRSDRLALDEESRTDG